MFLVIDIYDSYDKEIVYIPDNDPKTICEAAESNCGEYDAFLYDNELYDCNDIIKEFTKRGIIKDDSYIDFDALRESLDIGDVTLDNIYSFARIKVFDTDHLTVSGEIQ